MYTQRVKTLYEVAASINKDVIVRVRYQKKMLLPQ